MPPTVLPYIFHLLIFTVDLFLHDDSPTPDPVITLLNCHPTLRAQTLPPKSANLTQIEGMGSRKPGRSCPRPLNKVRYISLASTFSCTEPLGACVLERLSMWVPIGWISKTIMYCCRWASAFDRHTISSCIDAGYNAVPRPHFNGELSLNYIHRCPRCPPSAPSTLFSKMETILTS
jgi:hypothetical protein